MYLCGHRYWFHLSPTTLGGGLSIRKWMDGQHGNPTVELRALCLLQVLKLRAFPSKDSEITSPAPLLPKNKQK